PSGVPARADLVLPGASLVYNTQRMPRRSGGIGRRARLRAWLPLLAVQVQVLSPALTRAIGLLLAASRGPSLVAGHDGSRLHLGRELLAELRHLRRHHALAVPLGRVGAEIPLVVVLRLVKVLQRHHLRDDGPRPDLLGVQLGD